MVVLPGVGVNISKFQHRVPDVAVVRVDAFETVFQETPPELVVEVTGPEGQSSTVCRCPAGQVPMVQS